MSRRSRRRVSLLAAVATLMSVFVLAPASSAAPPGDNGPIVYVDADGELRSVNADGTGDELVAEGLFMSPDVSSDGTQVLAVEREDAADLDGALVVVDLASGETDVVVESGVTSGAWSGDDTSIAYASDGLWVKAGDADAEEVAGGDDVNAVWDWSPVDDRVLVTRAVPPSGPGLPSVSLETIDVETGDAVVIDDNEGGLFTRYTAGADFSPDGEGIAYVRAAPGVTQVLIDGVDDPIDESDVEGQDSGAVTWSPDGAQIAYGRNNVDGEVVVIHTVASGAETSFDLAGGTGAIDWAPVPSDTPPPPEEGEFTDVPADHTFAAEIAWLAEQGITKGCNPPANTEFCPEDFVTRGQMAAFLVRGFGYSDVGTGDHFTDDDGSVFEGDIDRLATAGVTKGCNPPDNTLFCPNDFVTRAQMAAFLVRAFGYSDAGTGDHFTDDDGSVFEEDIDRLATAGVTRGCNPPENTLYCPGDNITRGQMAAFLFRAFTSAST